MNERRAKSEWERGIGEDEKGREKKGKVIEEKEKERKQHKDERRKERVRIGQRLPDNVQLNVRK